MAASTEIKAQIHTTITLQETLEAISDTPVQEIFHEDIFFHTSKGRLKLRILSADSGQVIYYEQDTVSGPKPSNCHIYPTSTPASLKQNLSSEYTVRGTIKKKRLLYMVKNARIHLDEVDGLGTFLEIEVVLNPGQSVEEGAHIAHGLIDTLGITGEDMSEEAYIDLMEKSNSLVR
jgi:predicted adenylyl cyclase CyaB